MIDNHFKSIRMFRSKIELKNHKKIFKVIAVEIQVACTFVPSNFQPSDPLQRPSISWFRNIQFRIRILDWNKSFISVENNLYLQSPNLTEKIPYKIDVWKNYQPVT